LGQKVNPIGLRTAIDKNWRSRWFCGKKEFGNLLHEDEKIRGIVKKRLENAAVPGVTIERYANRVRVNVFSARPGFVIGHKGQDIDRIREELVKVTGREIYLEIKEIRNPDTNAQLVAENIALQVARRVSLRRAMKRAMQLAMDMGVDGIKIRAGGRLGGAEIARVEWYKSGKIPLHTLRAKIDYGFAESFTKAGLIGIKVWIAKSEKEDAAPPVRRRAAHAAHA
jgi:small subunit ribosomal protein S3